MERVDRREYYEKERDRYSLLYNADLRTLTILSLFRLALFVLGLTASVLAFRINSVAGTLTILSVVVLFIWIIKLFTQRSWIRDYNLNLIEINKNELRCLEGDWSIFNRGDKYSDSAHDFSHDIDLFGDSSLFQYLDRSSSDPGADNLAHWLLNPYNISSDYAERAEAIRELSGKVGWRQRFSGLGYMNRAADEDRIRLNNWLNEKPVFRSERVVIGLTILFPLISIVLLALSIFGVVGFAAFVLSIIVNLTILAFYLKRINSVHTLVSKQYFALITIKSLIEHFNGEEFNSALLKRFKERMEGLEIGALESIAKLSKIVQAFDSRLNMVVGIILNGLLLFDLISVLRLEKWKRELKTLIPVWFDDLGVIDALSSLANYAYNNPGYSYPELSKGNSVIEAAELGHPLILEHKRVVNDFHISKKGEIAIITGANMAGKSTFLRTVAINFVLAMIGAPVCATRFTFLPANIFSSMRTSDSLSESESYFYAELKRLRQLKERIVKGEPLLFILDEILKGTNSKDKSEGSMLFIEKILRYSATGLVATHDIVLGDLEKKYPENIRNLCFEITIEDDRISFDYLLRKGITTKMNAAILMKQHGIID